MTLDQAMGRISELEHLLGVSTPFTPALSLSPNERKVAGVLLARGGARTEVLVAALYGDRQDGGPEYARRCVWMAVHELRKKIKSHGIKIRTVRFQGYEISEADQAKLRALVATVKRDEK